MDADHADGLSADERAAARERAAERATDTRRRGRADKAAAAAHDVLAKIAGMEPADRAIAERFHALVAAHAPELRPKLWYGQPAYARDGKVLCFFRSGHDDRERYSTIGFTAEARLDQPSGLWPTSYAVAELTGEAEQTLVTLLRQAVG